MFNLNSIDVIGFSFRALLISKLVFKIDTEWKGQQ